MSTISKTLKALEKFSSFIEIDQFNNQIEAKQNEIHNNERFEVEFQPTLESTKKRLEFLKEKFDHSLSHLSNHVDELPFDQMKGNIENFIGMTQVPTGIIGPVKVLGSAAKGEFMVPLATTEGALLASYHRGAKACYLAGGVTSICLIEAVQRSPVFKFHHMGQLGQFMSFLFNNNEKLQEIVRQTSRYANLEDIKPRVEGNQLIVTFEYTTGDAAGQNMVTICTDSLCRYIIEHAPVKPVEWYIESNYSGDKKANASSFSNVRGKKISAEIQMSKEIVGDVLKTTPEVMMKYWLASTIGVIQSGAIGAQGHYANGLTALFMATGQDVACVAEAAVGVTRMEVTEKGDLYAAITLPNIIVGTVGGGTGLPTQRECLELMDCYGEGKARKFAEICGAVILAGELSIAAAMSVGHFVSAHKNLGR